MTPYFQKATQLVQQLEASGFTVQRHDLWQHPYVFTAHKQLDDGTFAACCAREDAEGTLFAKTRGAATLQDAVADAWAAFNEEPDTSEAEAEQALAL